MNCELCQSINENYRLIKKSKHSFCIINIEPLKKGHLMVLPKRHITNLKNLKPEESKDLLRLVEKIKNLLKQKYEEDPLILINTGRHSSQEHIHIHVWPSKASLRELVSKYEKVPKRKKATTQELQETKSFLGKIIN